MEKDWHLPVTHSPCGTPRNGTHKYRPGPTFISGTGTTTYTQRIPVKLCWQYERICITGSFGCRFQQMPNGTRSDFSSHACHCLAARRMQSPLSGPCLVKTGKMGTVGPDVGRRVSPPTRAATRVLRGKHPRDMRTAERAGSDPRPPTCLSSEPGGG